MWDKPKLPPITEIDEETRKRNRRRRHDTYLQIYADWAQDIVKTAQQELREDSPLKTFPLILQLAMQEVQYKAEYMQKLFEDTLNLCNMARIKCGCEEAELELEGEKND